MTIALVGKYVQLHDAYLSVWEALKHSAIHHGRELRMLWVDSEEIARDTVEERLALADGVIVPGGFGYRGIEGKIEAIQYCRERRIPYLGVCLGMQCAVIEFARNVCGLEGANSREFDEETSYPVIDLLPEQKAVEDMGGTMRLGAQRVELVPGTRAAEAYGSDETFERHRHRFEVNNALRPQLETAGLRRQRHPRRRPPGRDRRAAATTPSSSPRSSIPSSSRVPRAPRRSSASSSGRRRATTSNAKASSRRASGSREP